MLLELNLFKKTLPKTSVQVSITGLHCNPKQITYDPIFQSI